MIATEIAMKAATTTDHSPMANAAKLICEINSLSPFEFVSIYGVSMPRWQAKIAEAGLMSLLAQELLA